MNPSYPEIILSILSVLIGIGAIIAGLGYFLGQYRQGSNKNTLDTINLFKERTEALEIKVNEQNDDIVELTKKIDDLTVIVQEKDKELMKTLNILQGRDPQTQAIMLSLEEYVRVNKPMLEQIRLEIIPVVKKLDKFLDKQVI